MSVITQLIWSSEQPIQVSTEQIFAQFIIHTKPKEDSPLRIYFPVH